MVYWELSQDGIYNDNQIGWLLREPNHIYAIGYPWTVNIIGDAR